MKNGKTHIVPRLPANAHKNKIRAHAFQHERNPNYRPQCLEYLTDTFLRIDQIFYQHLILPQMTTGKKQPEKTRKRHNADATQLNQNGNDTLAHNRKR